MKRAHAMVAAGATLSVLTLPWAATAQQPSAPTETKVQRVREMVNSRSEVGIDRENATSGLVQDLSERLAVSPVDTGGDVDADWQRLQSSGEETGVERPPDAPVITSDEILSARDRRRWRIEQHTKEQAREAGES